ncbi:hypothetical protein OAQ99_01340 [Candidatus Kapabacteria bacterium]|nr:hypothetical protein [Candidatus Kapabacteria bacterium]
MKTIIFIILANVCLYGQDVFIPNITVLENPNPCGGFEDRRVTLIVDIGKVLPSHQLYGFEFGIEYDSTKMVFDNLINQTTFLEFFGESVSVQGSKHFVTGGGALLSGGPISGDRPLFAISFRYFEDVFDTTSIKLTYLYMLEEFTGTIDLLNIDYPKIVPEIESNTLRDIDITVKDSIVFDSTKQVEASIMLSSNNLSRVNNLLMNIEIDNNLYLLKDAYSDNSSILLENNKILLEDVADNTVEIKIVLEQLTDSVNSKLEFSIEDVNQSSCINIDTKSETMLIAYEELSTFISNEELEIEISGGLIRNTKRFDLKIYDQIGRVIYSGNDNLIAINNNIVFLEIDLHDKKIIKSLINF